ncbi:ParB/RepB/Spo0J family partition protein [Pseudomonas carnis]|mgnify:CR=1 FL=1|uniref:ParB/RepB/Spo0J family partition protein n=1 Tax=Pseudomonas carnis TaxID=2487355 RepID=UPI0022B88AB7|nr:ParB/RepB/Spo0J family partition protein [Pseudomonas carnis]
MATGKVGRGLQPRSRLVQNILDAHRHNVQGVAKQFRQLQTMKLRPGIYQSRRSFKPRELTELGASMKATGMNITPLIVRPVPGTDFYEIICGERRWRAAQLIEMDTLLCCIGSFTDDQALYMCGAENLQREDLNALEEALAYDNFSMSGMSHQQIADEIGKSRTHVTNYLRLLGLPLRVRDMLEQEKLTFAQARPICGLTAQGVQISVAQEAVKKKWTAKQVERAVADLQVKRKAPKPLAVADANINRLIEMVSSQVGYPVVIVKTPAGRWQLGLSASSVEEFEGILERLGVKIDEL